MKKQITDYLVTATDNGKPVEIQRQSRQAAETKAKYLKEKGLTNVNIEKRIRNLNCINVAY